MNACRRLTAWSLVDGADEREDTRGSKQQAVRYSRLHHGQETVLWLRAFAWLHGCPTGQVGDRRMDTLGWKHG